MAANVELAMDASSNSDLIAAHSIFQYPHCLKIGFDEIGGTDDPVWPLRYSTLTVT